MLRITLVALLIGCVSILGACANQEDEAFEMVTKMAAITGPGGSQEDHDYYLEHVTDNFNSLWGYPTVADCAAKIKECIGDDTFDPPKRNSLELDGDSGTFTVTQTESSPSGDTMKTAFNVGIVKEDGVWKLDSISAGDGEIPSGVELVPLELNEMGFLYDGTNASLKSGKFAFDIENKGDQVHEAVLLHLKKEGPLMELMESMGPEGPDPEVIGFLGVKVPVIPGASAKMAVPELEAGRYALICFLPDTSVPGKEKPPHFALGMVSEFSVE
jgi:uncharacterized cupredoxin-like copper-binding protein